MARFDRWIDRGHVPVSTHVFDADSGHASHPGHLAPAVSAVEQLDPVEVAFEELGKPDRRAGRPGRIRRDRPLDLFGRTGRRHRLDPPVDPLDQGFVVVDQAEKQGRPAQVRRPELSPALVVRRRRLAVADQFDRAGDPFAVVRVDRIPELGRQGRVQRFRALRLRVAFDLFPERVGDRRAEVEVGQCGPQVEAGAADDDRLPAFGEAAVDLFVGPLPVAAGAELLVDRDEAGQPVLEALPAPPGSRRR